MTFQFGNPVALAAARAEAFAAADGRRHRVRPLSSISSGTIVVYCSAGRAGLLGCPLQIAHSRILHLGGTYGQPLPRRLWYALHAQHNPLRDCRLIRINSGKYDHYGIKLRKETQFSNLRQSNQGAGVNGNRERLGSHVRDDCSSRVVAGASEASLFHARGLQGCIERPPSLLASSVQSALHG
jgi:hypothetical protein